MDTTPGDSVGTQEGFSTWRFREPAVLLWIALAGMGYAIYIALHSLGVVTWRLYFSETGFPASEPATWMLVVSLFGCGALLVRFSRTRIDLDEEKLIYHGFIRTLEVRWSEVNHLTMRRSTGLIWIRVGPQRIRLPMLSPAKELQRELARHVRLRAPNAEIDCPELP
jgi:hypothetical protein